MSVECYALVTFNKKLTKHELSYNKHLKLEGFTRAMLVDLKEIHLCHLRLVQPLGKSGKVPLPRWEVVERLLNQNQCKQSDNWDELWTRNGEPIHIGYLWRIILYKNDVPFLYTREKVMLYRDDCDPEYHYDSERFVTIDDKRIQLRQIRSLFPECAKMPMAIALDYVRDRM